MIDPHPAAAYIMAVEAGKIREFAAATCSQLIDYYQPDALIPPTFLVASSFWAPPDSHPDVDFDPRRMLHGEQEYIFHGPPPRAGDWLLVTSHIAERAVKVGRRGGTMRTALIVTEFSDPDTRALLVEQRTTLLETAALTEGSST